MTDLYLDTSHIPDTGDAARAPAGSVIRAELNRFVDLEPITQVITSIMALVKLAIEGDRVSDIWRLTKQKGEQSKRLELAKWHNFKTALKWTMLRRPEWRDKVMDDLGGEAAMTRWEARAETAKTAIPKPYTPRIYKRPPMASLRTGMIDIPPARTPFDVKTDVSGCFRLAPISSPQPTKPEGFIADDLTIEQKADRKEAWRLRRDLRARQHPKGPLDTETLTGFWYKNPHDNTIRRMAPIPLTPGELRGERDDDGPNDTSEAIKQSLDLFGDPPPHVRPFRLPGESHDSDITPPPWPD